MLQHELVQDGGGVQVLGEEGLLGVGVGTLRPDLAVLPHHQLGGEALLQHIGVVVHVVEGDHQGLFPLWQHQGVADHVGARLVGDLAPHVLHGHQDVALVIEVLEDLLVLVHRHHPVVQALLLALGGGAVVEGPLGIGDDRVEEEVLHHLAGTPGLGELLLRPVAPHGVIGVGRRGGAGGRDRLRLLDGGGTGLPMGFLPAAAGGEAQGEPQGQQQGRGTGELFHHWVPPLFF